MTPHKALGLILHLIYENILEDFAEQKSEKNAITFGLV
jgi:hypothetical protein